MGAESLGVGVAAVGELGSSNCDKKSNSPCQFGFGSSVCPQCQLQFDTASRRAIQEACGHVKCRPCFILNENGCLQCEKDKHQQLAIRAQSEEAVTTTTSTHTKKNTESPVSKKNPNPDGKFVKTSNRKSNKLKWISRNKYLFGSLDLADPDLDTSTGGERKRKSVSLCEKGKQNKLYKCELCERHFTTRAYLDYHVRIHTGEKSFECSICSKAFKSNFQLGRHMFAHNGESNEVCEICGKKLQTKEALIIHQRSHSGERPFSCDVCEKKYPSVGNLNRHRVSHFRSKNFLCSECGKRFISNSSLMVHMQSHERDRNFPCDKCRLQFKKKIELNRHQLSHMELEYLPCPIWNCDRRFRRNDNLVRHLKLTHEQTKEEAAECLKSANSSMLEVSSPQNCVKVKEGLETSEMDNPASDEQRDIKSLPECRPSHTEESISRSYFTFTPTISELRPHNDVPFLKKSRSNETSGAESVEKRLTMLPQSISLEEGTSSSSQLNFPYSSNNEAVSNEYILRTNVQPIQNGTELYHDSLNYSPDLLPVPSSSSYLSIRASIQSTTKVTTTSVIKSTDSFENRGKYLDQPSLVYGVDHPNQDQLYNHADQCYPLQSAFISSYDYESNCHRRQEDDLSSGGDLRSYDISHDCHQLIANEGNPNPLPLLPGPGYDDRTSSLAVPQVNQFFTREIEGPYVNRLVRRDLIEMSHYDEFYVPESNTYVTDISYPNRPNQEMQQLDNQSYHLNPSPTAVSSSLSELVRPTCFSVIRRTSPLLNTDALNTSTSNCYRETQETETNLNNNIEHSRSSSSHWTRDPRKNFLWENFNHQYKS